MTGYPDSHLSGREGRKIGKRTATLLAAAPVVVLITWFVYLWSISAVLPSKEKYRSGKIKAEGSVKRVGIGEYVRQGHWVTYHENGTKASEGEYNLGKHVGEWKCWDEGGHPTRCDLQPEGPQAGSG